MRAVSFSYNFFADREEGRSTTTPALLCTPNFRELRIGEIHDAVKVRIGPAR
jgi:hypothetical protein